MTGGVERSSLRDQIRDWILQRISLGEFAPGDRIREHAVAEQLHVSPIPVREAIRELVALGMLESEVHRGAWVRTVDLQETIEALQVRAAIEPMALLVGGPDIVALPAKLRDVAARLVKAASQKEFGEYHRLNQQFHRTIVEAAGSKVMLRVWDSLAYEVSARSVLHSIPSLNAVSVAREHGEVLKAIERKDLAGAAQLLREHTLRLARQLEQREHPEKRSPAPRKARRPVAASD